MRFAERVRPSRIIGTEIQPKPAERSRARGIEIPSLDLNAKLEIPDGTVDVDTVNQVIEHLYDTDQFARELHRVLKPGAIAVVSTNNLASSHNVIALVLGAQQFPADVSSNSAIGKLVQLFPGDSGAYSSWTHLRVFSIRALREMLEYHGFTIERIQGVGYYPLPSTLANRIARRAPRHAAYLTVTCSRR
jgi:2-polyprenyl-3-methyl-5-hydroxy-6-metoxy-1,4-benzoquinol methylase